MSEPCDLDAVELRHLIGTRRLSPVELLDACMCRIEALNPELNAIVNLCPERARAEALDAERAVARGDDLGPLHGLPLGVKDLNHVAGIRTTFGSPLFADFVPDADEGVVARMRAAGAIVVGKTNVPEHGFGATTVNPLYGATSNPFAPGLSAGASSGGSAAALASGMVPLAMGSDFAGSLRTPASFCGISGFRPSPGTVAQTRRPFAYSPFDVEGPMGRTAADCKLLLCAMVGHDPRDPLSRAPDASMREAPHMVDLAGLRVGTSEDLGFAPVSQEVRRTFRHKLDAFSSLFRSCEGGTAPDTSNADRAFYILRGVGFVADFKPMYDENPGAFGPVISDELARAGRLGIADIGWAEKERTRIVAGAQAFFEDHDLLITPAASVPPFPNEALYPKAIDGEDMGGYLRWEAIAYGVTMMSNPALVIPCGRGPEGLPFGLQVVGPLGRDAWLLDVGHTLEACLSTIEGLGRPRPGRHRRRTDAVPAPARATPPGVNAGERR